MLIGRRVTGIVAAAILTALLPVSASARVPFSFSGWRDVGTGSTIPVRVTDPRPPARTSIRAIPQFVDVTVFADDRIRIDQWDIYSEDRTELLLTAVVPFESVLTDHIPMRSWSSDRLAVMDMEGNKSAAFVAVFDDRTTANRDITIETDRTLELTVTDSKEFRYQFERFRFEVPEPSTCALFLIALFVNPLSRLRKPANRAGAAMQVAGLSGDVTRPGSVQL